MPTLFDPHHLGDLALPNRIAMAPMTRVRSTPDGMATSSMAVYYAQRASAGLLVSEGIWPHPIGQSIPLTPGLVNTAQAQSWRQVTGAVHANGGRIFAQLMHSGRMSHPDTIGAQPVAPSAVAAAAEVFTPTGKKPAPLPRALRTAEVADHARSYGEAARYALDAGFDGVELHGANGYLISQFLSSNVNRRTDRYGGSIAGRITFAVAAVEAAVEAIGAGRVGIRLSPGAGIWDTVEENIPQLYSALLKALAPYDLAYIHLVDTTDEETLLSLRRVWTGTLMITPTDHATRSPSDRARAERWLGLGADMVSFARAYIANPDLVERFRADLPLAEADLATYYAGGDAGYLTYPSYQR